MDVSYGKDGETRKMFRVVDLKTGEVVNLGESLVGVITLALFIALKNDPRLRSALEELGYGVQWY